MASLLDEPTLPTPTTTATPRSDNITATSSFSSSSDNDSQMTTKLTTTTTTMSSPQSVIIIEEQQHHYDYYANNENEDFSQYLDSNNQNNNKYCCGRCCHWFRLNIYCFYIYSIGRMFCVDIILNYTNYNNTSLVALLIKTIITISSYFYLYTTAIIHLFIGITYLMEHSWYILAISGSVTILVLSTILLTILQWAWNWQHCLFSRINNGQEDQTMYTSILITDANDEDNVEQQSSSNSQPRQRRRQITVDNDDDDVSFMGWMKRFSKIFLFVILWWLYCLLNIHVDYWISQILHHDDMGTSHTIMTRLWNGIQATPILIGSAILLYFVFPSFYNNNQWQHLQYNIASRINDSPAVGANNSTRTTGRTGSINGEQQQQQQHRQGGVYGERNVDCNAVLTFV